MRAAWLTFLLLLASAASPAGAAIVRLKDGAMIEGTVISSDARELVIRTPSGSRRVDAALVRSVEYEAATPPETPRPAAPPAEPRRSEDKNAVSFGLGLAAPLSDVDFHAVGGGRANDGDLGALIDIRYLRSLTNRFGAGLEFDYFHRAPTVSPGLLPLADSSVQGDNLLMLAVARWNLLDRGSVRPYLLGGAGASRSWTRIHAAPIRGFAWTDTNTDETRRLIDDSVWAFAAAARLGLDFQWEFADPGVFGLEAGWTGLESRTYGATRSGQDLGLTSVSSRLDLFTFTARWSLRW